MVAEQKILVVDGGKRKILPEIKVPYSALLFASYLIYGRFWECDDV